MSFGDPYTLDDLLREIHHPASGGRVTLTREQALNLDREPDPDGVALEAAYEQGRGDVINQCCKRCRTKLAKADAA
jgi:hypothetical protein